MTCFLDRDWSSASVISQCGSGGLDDYKPSRTNMARMKLEGQLDVVDYSRITILVSVHMSDPAGG